MNSKVAIITGASRGIGKAIALKLITERYRVALVSDDQPELEQVADDIHPDEVLLMPGDLSDLDFARQVVIHTMEKWERIDVLINNAAWRTVETLRTISVDDWEKTLRICLTAPAFLAKYAAHFMEEQGRTGVIVNVSSVMADRPGGTSPAYVACKGAILSLTYELAALLGPSGIRVVAISPGNIVTKLSQEFVDDQGVNITSNLVNDFESHTPLQRSGQPQEVANAVAWLCGEEASYITGMNLVIDGGFSKNFNGYGLKKLQFPDQF